MNRVVVDASVAVPWYVEEPATPRAVPLQLGSDILLAPGFLLLEVASAILKRQRRGIPTAADYPEAALRELRASPIAFTPDDVLLDAAAAVSRTLRHPFYDCLYLALARREEALLATFDERLRDCARYLAVPLWEPPT